MKVRNRVTVRVRVNPDLPLTLTLTLALSHDQLRELALDRNKIRQLDPLALRGLTNLRELRLEEVRGG